MSLTYRLSLEWNRKFLYGTPVKSLTFSNTLHCLKTVKTDFMQQVINDRVFSSLHKVENNSFESGIKKIEMFLPLEEHLSKYQRELEV
ncbi:hypothetical protein TNCV_4724151 [Trichonephila clavipes]|uniref:Uncharacterized protein n=1 Tax=Trichonephila clavipes TaxID=2585209 RepID=A0A8X6W6N2_TRICX|nr:hypothetical protein TNCV_4724151 [Trichonephila clavipes]